MRFAVKSLAVALVLGVAACQNPPPPVQQDTGNMAFPSPLPQGNISTTRTTGTGVPDTGNMAYPTPQAAGVLRTTPTTRTTP